MSETLQSRSRTWQVGALLFGSGCCALVYQTVWMREFRLVFGASTAASAAVLAIFVGGLGLGSLWLGPAADRRPRPILFYAQLESVIGISAAVTPFLLAFVQWIYVSIGGTPRIGILPGTVIRLILSALVLAIPTFLMGGTLPAAARGVTRQTDARRQDVAALYALNTLGAVFGCAVATFLLLELFGTHATLWLAAAVNLLVAMFARQVDRRWPPLGDGPSTDAGEVDRDRQAPLPFLLTASAVVGFAFFLMELVWYRMLGPLLGGSVFTFGLILAIALLGIAVGGLLYSLINAERPATLSGFAVSCLLEASFLAAAFAAGDRLAVLALVLVPLGHTGFLAQVAGWSLVTAIVVLPAALVAGYQFPLLIGLFGRGRAAVGRQIGLAYAANTLGAILGSLTGGFGLLPLLSAQGTWRFAAAALIGLGGTAAVLSWISAARRWPTVPLAIGALTVVLLTATGPTAVWRDSGIGAGRAPAVGSRNQLRAWSNSIKSSREWSVDGVESSVSLVAAHTGYAFYVNGKSDGSARMDAGTQIMLGLLGTALHDHPRRSLVIGLGTGSTAGWLGALPGMERVDVIELEPVVLDVARACRPVNRGVLDNRKVHISIGDAREVLLTSRQEYDVIASEPSNPFRAGVASLFTQEYYRAAWNRLAEDGLFLQWVQAYEIDARTLRTIYATMGSVFPSVETWQPSGSDLVLIGAKRPIAYRSAALQARIREDPYRSALHLVWRANDLNGFLAHFVAGDGLTRAITRLPSVDLNTDDRNVVEFGFARTVGRGSSINTELRQLAALTGAGRPAITDTTVDWSAVNTAWVSYLAGEQQLVNVNPVDPPGEQARQQALIRYFLRNDTPTARNAWTGHTRDDLDVNELAMLADIEADADSDRALEFIERLRAFEPTEADVLLARLRFKQGHDEEATAALESAFIRLRSDPWPLTRMSEAAIALTYPLTTRYPSVTRRLFSAAAEPFAIRAVEDQRRVLVATLAMRLDVRQCAAAFAVLEPYVPWDGGFLSMRRDCYKAVDDSRRVRAARDLTDFGAAEGLPLSAGITAAR